MAMPTCRSARPCIAMGTLVAIAVLAISSLVWADVPGESPTEAPKKVDAPESEKDAPKKENAATNKEDVSGAKPEGETKDPLAQPLDAPKPPKDVEPPSKTRVVVPKGPDKNADGIIGIVRGQNVNLRVGPRRGPHRIAQLNRGAVVVIVERIDDWLGIHVPVGFPAVASMRYLKPVAEGRVQIDATNLNLRVAIPGSGRAAPPAFRDHPKPGAVVPVIRTEGDWAWVLAPEYVRAYISARYVKELGPAREHQDVLAKAREFRKKNIAILDARRKEHVSRVSANRLREVIGHVQRELAELRRKNTLDQAPVIALRDHLRDGLKAHASALPRVRRLATAMYLDLEAEAALRAARADEALASGPPTGKASPAPRKPTPHAVGPVALTGIPRFEPTENNQGEWVLWQREAPSHVLRPAPGVNVSFPDLRRYDGKQTKVVGKQTKHRVFGLPLVMVHTLEPLPEPVVRKNPTGTR